MEEKPFESALKRKIHLKSTDGNATESSNSLSSVEPNSPNAINSSVSNEGRNSENAVAKSDDKKDGRHEWRDILVDPLLVVASLIGLGAVLFFCGTGSHQPATESPPAAKTAIHTTKPTEGAKSADAAKSSEAAKSADAAKPAEVDFHPYMKTLQQQIKSHWHPPNGSDTNYVKMHFKISKDGEVSDVGFDRLSHISDADAAALKAVVETMPSVGPLPPGSPDSVDISFSFDYNVQKKK